MPTDLQQRCAALSLTLVTLLAGGRLPAAAAADCPAAQASIDSRLAPRLDAIVDAAVADGFAGGVAVVHDGQLVYDRVAGLSKPRRGVPVTDATLFHVASISKYLTAVGVLAAAEAGRMDLDSSIAALAPGSSLGARGVTLTDLLAHRSGLGSTYVAESETDRATALTAIDATPVDLERVGGFRYSNDGYDLLAVLLESAYGKSYEEVMRDLVLEPACLSAPRFWAEVDLTDPATVSQPLRGIGRRLRKRNYGMIGSSGLLIRAADLVRFESALDAGHVLSPRSLAELRTGRGEVSIGEATYGAFLVDHPELGRYLSARGYEQWGDNAILNHYLERRLIVAVVTSKGPSEESGEEPFRTRLSREIEAVLVGHAAR